MAAYAALNPDQGRKLAAAGVERGPQVRGDDAAVGRTGATNLSAAGDPLDFKAEGQFQVPLLGGLEGEW